MLPDSLKTRWAQPSGYKDVLRVCLPLVVSMGSTTCMEFTDRVFLSHYSLDSIAAATPAVLAHLVLLLFFVGVVSYSNVFIAQYIGSGRFQRVGAVLWQAIWFALIGALVLALCYFIAGPLFRYVGHSDNIMALQITYFRILTVGSGCALLSSALSCFFSGRGLTRPIMIVNILAVLINIPLDYALIYGIGPLPELGIAGAGIATVSSWIMQVIMFCYLIFNRRHNQSYAVISARAFDKKLFKRMMTYGLPAGVNMFFELFAFTFFLFMVGRIGDIELAATNIVFSLNSIFFIPLMGMGIALSTLVGQAIGRGNYEEAVRATTNTLHIALAWTLLLTALFICIPEFFLSIFEPASGDGHGFDDVKVLGKSLLRFVVIYCIFDALFIVYSGAIKGAGDTKFIMWGIGLLGVLLLILPTYFAITRFGVGIWGSWIILSLYIVALGLLVYLRYRQGKWREIVVLEEE